MSAAPPHVGGARYLAHAKGSRARRAVQPHLGHRSWVRRCTWCCPLSCPGCCPTGLRRRRCHLDHRVAAGQNHREGMHCFRARAEARRDALESSSMQGCREVAATDRPPSFATDRPVVLVQPHTRSAASAEVGGPACSDGSVRIHMPIHPRTSETDARPTSCRHSRASPGGRALRVADPSRRRDVRPPRPSRSQRGRSRGRRG